MKRLCTICARGGSKGVPNKNIRPVLGQPLLAYTLKQAIRTRCFDLIAVSSDSAEILDIARKFGADILITRPTELATDSAAKLPVIRHAASFAESSSGQVFDTFIDLDATSPLRTPEDILEVVRIVEETGSGNVVTATAARRSPYFNLLERDAAGRLATSKQLPAAITRRQDAPPCYNMNASIYAWKRSALFNSDTLFLEDTALYLMPEEHSLDIDSELDFELVAYLLAKRNPTHEDPI